MGFLHVFALACFVSDAKHTKRRVLRRVLHVFVEICLFCKQNKGRIRHDVKMVVSHGFFAGFWPCLLCKQRSASKARCFTSCFCLFSSNFACFASKARDVYDMM